MASEPEPVPPSSGPAHGGRSVRDIAATALIVVAAIALLAGGPLLYAREALFDSRAFADRTVAALQDDAVRQAIAERVTAAAIEHGSDELLQARPLIEGVVAAALDTAPFRSIIRQAAIGAHRLFFDRDRESFVLDVADAGVVIVGALRGIAPDIAERIPRDLKPTLLEISDRDFAAGTLQAAAKVRVLGVVLPLLALVLYAAAIGIAPRRRRAFIQAGVSVGVAAAPALIGLIIGRAVLLGHIGDEVDRDAVSALWSAYLGDLRTWILATGAAGLIVAGAASSMLQAVEVTGRLRRAWAWFAATPARPWLRAVRGVAIAAAGIGVVLEPAVAVQILAVVAGAAAVFYGSSEILAVVAPPRDRRRPGGAALAAARRSPRRAIAIGGGAALAVAAIAGLVAIVVGGDDRPGPQSRPDRAAVYCNGFRELCHRRLNEVAFAGTHNAMAAAARRGWFFAAHRDGMYDQLRAGVRALFIDTHYGVRDEQRGIVRTDIRYEGKDRKALVDELGEEPVAAAERLSGRLGFRASANQREAFLCHTLCELGATGLTEGLKEIRTFLDRHPDDLVIVFIQDAISAADTARAFRASGLDHFAYVHERDRPWPTMRELIESDNRVLVLAEEDRSSEPPWYHPGFELSQDTPFRFHRNEDFAAVQSCELNRGDASSPLFLVNHWIERVNPSPAVARRANRFDVLMERARRCQRKRRMLPNMISVDFADEGDVFQVVNVLNRLPRDAQPTLPTRASATG